jgi:hypothetical protein
MADQSSSPFRDRLGCTPIEACRALGIGRTLLYQLIAGGRVAVRKLGRRTVVSVPSLLTLMEDEGLSPRPRRRGRRNDPLP